MQTTYNTTYPKTPVELIKAINNLKLDYAIETKSLFSELGPVVLGQVISKVTKLSLPDAFFQVLTIAGMRDTVFRPTTDKYKIAPSGYTEHIAWGTPYNKLAHFLNDTAGNAGIFSTVSDVTTYMQILLNKGQLPGYSRVWTEDTIGKFLNVTKYAKFNNTRALGWDTIPSTGCPCGKKFSPSPNSFGLSDPPSGSYIWSDKKRNVTIVLLANGAFPAKSASDPLPYQAEISDAIMTALGY